MRCALLGPSPHSGGQFGVDFCGRKAVSGFCTAVDAGVNDRAGDGPEADAHFGFARGIAAGCSEKFCRWVKGCGYMLRVFGRNEGATVWFRDAFECFLAYPMAAWRLPAGQRVHLGAPRKRSLPSVQGTHGPEESSWLCSLHS